MTSHRPGGPRSSIGGRGFGALDEPRLGAEDFRVLRDVINACCGIDLAPGQTIDDCPPSEVYFQQYTDFATKTWISPYDPGEGPDDCTENPYDYDSIYCPPAGDGGHAQKNKASVAFLLGKHCKKRAFTLRPTYSDGIVLWSRLQLNGKKINTLKKPPNTI